MIDTAIGHIAGQLNQALRRTLRIGEDLVVVSNILDQDGSVAPHTANKLIAFLVNIEREPTAYSAATRTAASGGRSAAMAPPVYLNLLVMFAANFSGSNYPEALKLISSTIAFFQSHAVLDHHNSPDLDPRIEKLTLEIENLSASDLSNLWGILSGKYLPSILYRVRMITVDAGLLTGLRSRVGHVEIGAQG